MKLSDVLSRMKDDNLVILVDTTQKGISGSCDCLKDMLSDRALSLQVREVSSISDDEQSAVLVVVEEGVKIDHPAL